MLTEDSSVNSIESSASRLRRPFHYPVNKRFIGHPVRSEDDLHISATYSRHRYYSRLMGNSSEDANLLQVPNHVLPVHFIIPHFPFGEYSAKSSSDGKQGSLLTIFAIWNMLLGSTLLCLPWAMHQAGLYCGVAIMLFMLMVCFYTADLIVRIPNLCRISCAEFSDACGILLGRWALVTCNFFSQVSLIGTCVVYWILMSNFLYHIVYYVFDIVENNATISIDIDGSDDVFCDLKPADKNSSFFHALLKLGQGNGTSNANDFFAQIWGMQTTVPFALGFLLVPLIFVKSPSVFMKFNAFGTVSVFLLLAFVGFKSWKWDFLNINMNQPDDMFYVPAYNGSFPVLSGVLSQAMFVHNCIQTVFQLQRKPENNSRDLGIAFILVGLTYFAIALLIYLAFPLAKSCIADNFLDNFESSDLPAFLARVVMFFQLLCLFPLYTYMLRSQVFYMLFGESVEPTFCHLTAFNSVVVFTSIVFAMYIPKIGDIIRFVGAISGMVMVFTFPPIAHLRALQIHRSEQSSCSTRCTIKNIPVFRLFFHVFLIAFGIVNCIAQFLY
ncbi:Sodium-coupled neutral amino acid transporter 9 -like protein [Halotydeus destructor]|nr:Sodium-coupled neutral amino acid transporter 9 -like protein [Halotydeus destructor]